MNSSAFKFFQLIHGIIIILLLVPGCESPAPMYSHKSIYADSVGASLEQAAEVRANTAIELADGLKITLWASDSLAPDPIALSIDDYGRVYLTRTNRQKNSEFDIRGHQDWMTESISFESVEDRRAFLKMTFAPELSAQNTWLKDLNHDGIHDWNDLAVEKDEVWRLEDINKNGSADISTRILDDFHEEITDVAGALLVRRNDFFIGIGPDMWRISDSDGDGEMDTKKSISNGYAVHIGFSGHGMSGVVEGPDGRIYWGIGDIGANITSVDGRTFKYPNQGVLVRSNPDGSDFEVFAAGLRNTHEFVFDEYGNIIGADNDGDHPGESERLVHIVEGSDAGWRSNWQYGKYTDPKNNQYKVWMEEKLYQPRWEGQAAYIIPPITNFHNGPTGMAYNPGTALGSRWENKFFLVEFVGTPSRSPIWTFSLKRSGASFELDEEEKAVAGILPTGIRFGPDGALYIADWINGWGTKNSGRVWRLDVTEDNNDLKELRIQTKELMQADYDALDSDRLHELLFYPDLRIRQKAQFELADRGPESLSVFQKAIDQRDSQLARIHGVWGIGQLIRAHGVDGSSLVVLLDDEDPEIIAQAANIIGDVRLVSAGDHLINLLKSDNDRIKFFAAQGLGRMRYTVAINPLLEMLERNADQDVYIRHAGVLALSRIGNVEAMVSLKDHPSRSLRLAAVLVLRRMREPAVREFLGDADELIVAEAARAINDDWSVEQALPDLAATLGKTRFVSEPLLRRAINAASRVGGQKEIDQLIEFAGRTAVPPDLRAEALSVLGSWASPSVLDRVDGRYRGEVSREPDYVLSQLRPKVAQFLQSEDPVIIKATASAIVDLGLKDFDDHLFQLASTHSDPAVRAAMINSLHAIGHGKIKEAVQIGLNDQDELVRATSLGLINELDIPAETLPAFVNPVFQKGSLKEQQQVLSVLGEMPIEKTSPILEDLIGRWIQGDLDPGISLDLIEAIDSTKADRLIAMMAPHRPTGNTVEDYLDVLYGGDAKQGASVIRTNPAAQCVRCHSWDNKPGAVGPSLTGIANNLTREELLQALIEPSARLAPGYGSVILTLTDGSQISGILLEEHKSGLLLKSSNAEPLEIPIQRITKRQNIPSSMPAMGSILSRREIRDVVEFLSTMKGG